MAERVVATGERTGAAPGPVIAVVGAGVVVSAAVERAAEEVGRALAEVGAMVVCGGLGGVMAAACRGARSAGGATVGLLPGDDRRAANPWVTVPIATGLGELRNGLVVRAADAVVAIGGEHGTLSEIALALKLGRPVVGIGTWRLTRPDGSPEDRLVVATDPAEAVAAVLRLAGSDEVRQTGSGEDRQTGSGEVRQTGSGEDRQTGSGEDPSAQYG